jgi:hypothetical protein
MRYEFGDLVVDEDDLVWLVIGYADHQFTINGLDINYMGSSSQFSPDVGMYIVMVWTHDNMPRGFITQMSPDDISRLED